MSNEMRPVRMPDGEIRTDLSEKRQSPSLGRVVLFRPGDVTRLANGAEEYVAIIGQVFEAPGGEPPHCNLFVMPPFAAPYWEGSVQEAADGRQRSWRWPPRV